MATIFTDKALSTTLNDLAGSIQPALNNENALTVLTMLNRFLAHVQVRANTAKCETIQEELLALSQEEKEEDTIISQASAGSESMPNKDELGQYLRAELNIEGLEVIEIDASLGGYSKQTLLVSISGAPNLGDVIVLRLDQPGGPVKKRASDEMPILQAVFDAGIPVPEPIWAASVSPFGGSVLGMKLVPGKSVYDASGSIIGAGGVEAAKALAKVLAQVHSINVSELPFYDVANDKSIVDYIRGMVLEYQNQWLTDRTRPSPTLDAAFSYLLNNIPNTGIKCALVHGDASLRNVLMEEGKLSSFLDWELCHLGDPTEDLAYCRPDVTQVMDWQDFLNIYWENGGVDFNNSAAAYFSLFTCVRNVVFGESCLTGFAGSEHPSSKSVFAAIYLARKLIPLIAEQLELLETEK